MLISSSRRDALLKKIDLVAWKPTAWFVRFFPRRKNELTSKTAIIRPGGMGDLVLLTLAIQKLHYSLSDFRFFIQKRSEPWAKYLKLDYVVIDERPFSLLAHFGIYSKVINTEQYFGLATSLSLALGTKEAKIYGFNTNRGAGYFTDSLSYDHILAHELTTFADLLLLTNQKKEIVELQTTRIEKAQTYLCLSLSGRDSESRRLSKGQWEILISSLNKNDEIKILASPSEKFFGEELFGILSRSRKISLETGSFDEQIQILARAKELISVDGGMVHVASYFGVPSKVIFTSGQFSKWAPLAEGSEIIKRSDLPCQPCTVFGQTPKCVNNLKCLSVEEILKQRKI